MILVEYLAWHFLVAPRNIWEIAANYSRAYWHRFLIAQHLSTLFSPWHRRKPSDIGGSHGVSDFIINIIADFYIRILAAIVRTFIIITGLSVQLFILVVATVVFTIWILWPVVGTVIFAQGVNILSKYVF